MERAGGLLDPSRHLDELEVALAEVRAAAAAATFPLATASAGRAAQTAALVREQVDDYLEPRVRRLGAPLLAVVGGSTGAGKSTLVNSLVRSPVARAGVLRPTTRAPLLVAHPADMPWFAERSLLPHFERSTRPGPDTLQLVNTPALASGLALVDAPDIDSVVVENRRLGAELLGAADLWLFVTTARRYADAVPWSLLREAADRGTAIAVVLDRVPPEVREEVAAHLRQLMAVRGLGETPLFPVAESTLDGNGLLPELEVQPVKRWLDAVARDRTRRRSVATRTLLGALAGARDRIEALATAAQDQIDTAENLAGAVQRHLVGAVSSLERGLASGAALVGSTHGPWQRMVDSGGLTNARRGTAPPRAARQALVDAVGAALTAMVHEADLTATGGIREDWRHSQAGRELLAADPALGSPAVGFASAARDLIQGWQWWLMAAIRGERGDRPAGAIHLVATIASVAPPIEDVTADGAGPQALRQILGDETAARWGDLARAELRRRAGELFQGEVARHLAPITAAGVDPEAPAQLRAVAERLTLARAALAPWRGDAA